MSERPTKYRYQALTRGIAHATIHTLEQTVINSRNEKGRQPIDILFIGHVTRDLIDEAPDSDYRQGGTVSFAAATAHKLGRHPAVVTRAASVDDVAIMPKGTDIYLLPSAETTTFANVYTDHSRIQYCYAAAPPIKAEDIPASCRAPQAVLLGPLVNEIGPDVAGLFDENTLVVAVPQGWMRTWDETGRVFAKRWENAADILPHIDVLILSLEDIDYDTSRLIPVFDYLSLVVVTEYHDGSTILERQDDGSILETKIAPRPAVELDPTGAGDTFATAFMIRLQETEDAVESARFANVTASFSVEAKGISGAPDRQLVIDYMAEHPFTPEPPLKWVHSN